MKSKRQKLSVAALLLVGVAAILVTFNSSSNARHDKAGSQPPPPAASAAPPAGLSKEEAAWLERERLADSIPKSHFMEKIMDLRKTSKHRPEFDLLSRDGSVNPMAVTAAGLSGSETEAVGKLTTGLLQTISTYVKSSTKRVPNLSTNGVDAYRISAFSDRSEDDVARYFRAMSDAVGEERAWKLIKSLPIEQIAAGFGTREVIYRILPPDDINLERLTPEQIKVMHRVKGEYRDPSTGAVKGGFTTNYESFNETFLNALD